ncbi:chromosomal replication initiator protein DnaA [Streptomyces sp. NPDC093795]|uniref:chromosomal replication initiator protein DnaA n=1 Tax=Streptomyces sp. NPDC093795 TaxID=3366051 RepID=UPI003803F198
MPREVQVGEADRDGGHRFGLNTATDENDAGRQNTEEDREVRTTLRRAHGVAFPLSDGDSPRLLRAWGVAVDGTVATCCNGEVTAEDEQGVGMGSLVPLSSNLPDDARELAAALRSLFEGLGVSVRRYAARRHRDAGSISRFLNGTRVPSWDFVSDLINDVAEVQGRAPTVEAMEHVRGLHRTALEKSGAPQHRLQVLEDQLAEADIRSVRSSVLVKALEQALADAQHRVSNLEVQIRQLHGHQGRQDASTDQILQVYEDQVLGLRRERQSLLEQVDALADQLRDAHNRRVEAEKRCEELERQLVAAEEQWSVDNTSDLPGLASTEEFDAPLDVYREASDSRSSGSAVREVSKRLNQAYTFTNFVIGECNRFAHSAALAMAGESAGHQLLYVYGPSAVGKTHLLHAIGQHVLTRRQGARVEYVSAEEFTNSFVQAARAGSIGEFRRRYRSADVLLVDDVQFFSGKDVTQEEFFHTFNALHTANKHIVISADRPPMQIPSLAAHLLNRLEGGLAVQIEPPDLSTRAGIIRAKLGRENISFSEEVVDLIAQKVQRNVRELEGALARVNALATLNREPVSTSLAEKVLSMLVPDRQPLRGEETLRLILEQTAEYFGLTTTDLCGSERSRVLVTARQMAMYLCRELTDLLPTEIGSHFGGRAGDVVLHAENKVRALMMERRAIYNQISELTQRVKNSAEFSVM